MLCFQLVRTVLDELYKRIPGSESQKDAAIKNRLQHLGHVYENLHLGLQVDHSDITTRFAYIYRYVTCHANLVYQMVKAAKPLRSLFDQERVKITCIGGGPGSEIIGILKYLLEVEKNPQLRFILYDKEKVWGDCWNDVDDKLDLPMRFSHLDEATSLDGTVAGNQGAGRSGQRRRIQQRTTEPLPIWRGWRLLAPRQ